MEKLLAEGGDIRLDEQGDLISTPLKAEELPESVVALRAVIDKLLPQVELTDMLTVRRCGRSRYVDWIFR